MIRLLQQGYVVLMNLITRVRQDQKSCKRFKRLATVIQKYGHMYYHFVQEVLPRIILLVSPGHKPFLDADTKLLTFGSEHEFKWLAALGISRDMVEVYDPTIQYCAEELLVPEVSPVVTPPKENYDLVRAASSTLSILHIPVLTLALLYAAAVSIRPGGEAPTP